MVSLGWSKKFENLRIAVGKSNLFSKVDDLDKKIETIVLSPQEVELRHHLKGQLIKLLR
jgi:hypothetical protein